MEVSGHLNGYHGATSPWFTCRADVPSYYHQLQIQDFFKWDYKADYKAQPLYQLAILGLLQQKAGGNCRRVPSVSATAHAWWVIATTNTNSRKVSNRNVGKEVC